MQSERIVRYDPALAAAPLFQPVWRGDRPKLDRSFMFNGIEWRWRGPEQLGIAEQTLLLVLMELAAEQASRAEPVDEETRQIESELYNLRENRRPPTAELNVSFYELCRRLGRNAGGSAVSQRRCELKRLCEVTVWSRHDDGTEFQSRLLFWQVGDNKGVRVFLNWRLTEVLFGGQYSAVCLNERLSLRSECAKALHCALSLRIRGGATMAFHFEKLARYVWDDVGTRLSAKRQRDRAASETPAAIAMRRRRPELVEAIGEIGQLSTWTVKSTVNGAVQVSRRAAGRTEGALPRPLLPRLSTTPKKLVKVSASATKHSDPTGVWQIFARAAAQGKTG
ncbi:replication protein C, IncQ-type [Paraburkholderia sp. USG1]|uniref:replication protein C, IncQ-type n=1 Tax=Paraburkholderia sp. USG1 TaxID=2952268 RepID=UPI0038620876